MIHEKKTLYDKDESKPKTGSGVEVGGGDKAAAAVDPKARKQATPREPAEPAKSKKFDKARSPA